MCAAFSMKHSKTLKYTLVVLELSKHLLRWQIYFFLSVLRLTKYDNFQSCRFPVIFDDIAARLLPVIPLVVYRLIENDAMEHAERVLVMYKQLLAYHPLRFTFVRDILAYFYGHLPGKLIVRILNVLDISKVQDIFLLFIFILMLIVGSLFMADFFPDPKLGSDSFFRVISAAYRLIKFFNMPSTRLLCFPVIGFSK